MFKIEKNVSIPRKPNNQYPFANMEPGDSFFVETLDERKKVSTAATGYGKKHGQKFSVLKVDNGWRCWRTE